MDALPTPGRVVKTELRAGAGITEWTLSNGATVVLKPTTLKADQILFRAVAPGGTSLASDDEFIYARVADEVIAAGGAGRFNAVALDGDSPRRQPETPAIVERWNLEKSLAFYQARFADASHFTFVFVGSFTPESIKPLVETYIASLPATHANETWRDLGIAPPRGVIEKTIEKGIAPKSEVAIVFAGPFVYDDANNLALQTVTLLLQSRLSDAIREELGGTYNIAVNSEAAKNPRPQYRVRIDWTCDPARTAGLVQRVMEEV